MRRLITDLEALGKAAPRDRLRALGHSAKGIAAAARKQEVMTVGRNWVVLPDASPRLVTALRHRGVVGGATALRSYGVWVTERDQQVVAVRPCAHLVPLEDGVTRLQSRFETNPASPWRVTVLDALVQYGRRASRLNLIATVDSALHTGQLNAAGLEVLRRRLPKRCSPWLDRVNRLAEAGTESILRVACEDSGWNVEVQVPYRGGRLDLLLEGWLNLEADGSEFHDVAAQARKDRRRNNELILDDLRGHRFGYADVVHHLDASLAVVRALLRQGRPSGRGA